MGRYINIFLLCLIILVVFKFLIWISVPLVIIGVVIWGYFKYIKPYFAQVKNPTHKYKDINTDKTKFNNNDTFQGPIIDVDFEDIEKNN